MGDYKSCSTCANCVKTRRGWCCRLGNSTRGGRWSARCGEWTKKGEKEVKKRSKRMNYDIEKTLAKHGGEERE